jgi:SMC interacting uncharacterized protein involved in chromosome segregation
MSDDPRTELAQLRDTVHDGFTRMDRYFELQQEQHLTLRADVQELRVEVRELTRRVDRIEVRLTSVEHEVRAFRDGSAREFSDIRRAGKRAVAAVLKIRELIVLPTMARCETA